MPGPRYTPKTGAIDDFLWVAVIGNYSIRRDYAHAFMVLSGLTAKDRTNIRAELPQANFLMSGI